MVTIESEIYTELATALRAEFEDIFVSGEYVIAPPKFPAVSIEEADNYTDASRMDTETSKFSIVMYEINIYTNKTVGKKSQAKEILAVIDKVLIGRNFMRISNMSVPNMGDTSIYRISARYRAETDGENIYRYGF